MHDVTETFMGKKKNSFTVQQRPIDFKVIEYEKVTDVVSNTTLQPTFKKLLLVKFWCSVEEVII